MSLDYLINEVNDKVECFLEENMKPLERGHAHKTGLDRRAISTNNFWYGDTGICIRSNSAINAIEYYGGFEYIKPEYMNVIGEYKFYSSEDSRVNEVLQQLAEEVAEVAEVA